MLPTQSALRGWTGSVEMSVFQTLSAGKIAQGIAVVLRPGAVTVIAAVPLTPSLVAAIVTEPGVTPETSPPGLTVATAVWSLDHVTVRPDSAAPRASLGVAVSIAEFPAPRLATAGATTTVATGTAGATTFWSALFPQEASPVRTRAEVRIPAVLDRHGR
jgi:hypothetical protein